jgi:hypothetical protein
VAEFAPQAVEQIKEAPKELNGAGTGQGAGGGGGGGGGPSATTNGTTTPTVSDSGPEQARVRRCYGNPPRQTEDPQSPPCVPYWEGDNGGATTKGVTGDEIRIAVPQRDAGYAAGVDPRVITDFQTYFNRRYEFYGRHLTLVYNAGDFQGTDYPNGEIAAAAAADEQHHVFASTDTDWGLGGGYYRVELARRKIISAATFPQQSEAQMAKYRPYMWSYPMDTDDLLASMGQVYCRQFNGKTASHAGDVATQSKTRKLGIVLEQFSPLPVSDAPLQRELAKCNATIAQREVRQDKIAPDPSSWQTPMADMRLKNVTSVICMCYVTDMAEGVMPAATNQGFFPEWLLTPYWRTLCRNCLAVAPPNQLTSVLLLSGQPRDVAAARDPVMWALREVDPDYYNGQSAAGDPNTTATRADVYYHMYRSLLLLASGIQMAGPHLTPESFEAALQRTIFANADDGSKPGNVGFEGGRHSMIRDATLAWWSATDESAYNDGIKQGAYCYVDGGARYRLGGFPADDHSFQRPCDSGK